ILPAEENPIRTANLEDVFEVFHPLTTLDHEDGRDALVGGFHELGTEERVLPFPRQRVVPADMSSVIASPAASTFRWVPQATSRCLRIRFVLNLSEPHSVGTSVKKPADVMGIDGRGTHQR